MVLRASSSPDRALPVRDDRRTQRRKRESLCPWGQGARAKAHVSPSRAGEVQSSEVLSLLA